jgi:hypothetical protein
VERPFVRVIAYAAAIGGIKGFDTLRDFCFVHDKRLSNFSHKVRRFTLPQTTILHHPGRRIRNIG